ncbi:TRAP transporter small permease [Ammoniphilus sp. 3BR4]|uniref:TRAP transporter small permease n=1 Tax=Ammoniphilus sp. 3BR4 TaxID=3158265 RepID=UPI003467259E
MPKFKKYVDKTLELITGTLFLAMIAITTWQVISRYILNSPSTLLEEFLRFSLIWLSMLSAAYVVGKKSHIAFTLLRDRLVNKNKLVIDIVIQASFLVFAAVIMLFGGGKAVSLTMAQISPSLQVPMGLVYLSLPISGIFILFYSFSNLLELFGEKKGSLTQEDVFLSKKKIS